VTVEVNGKTLKTIFETTLQKDEFLQIGGACYSLDLNRPVGDRITSIRLMDADKKTCTGKEIDIQSTSNALTIATIDYIATKKGFPDLTGTLSVCGSIWFLVCVCVCVCV
jgi:hypothetical protein